MTVELLKGIPLKADKDYHSKKNTTLLKYRKVKNYILKKAVKNNPLTKWENNLIN